MNNEIMNRIENIVNLIKNNKIIVFVFSSYSAELKR